MLAAFLNSSHTPSDSLRFQILDLRLCFLSISSAASALPVMCLPASPVPAICCAQFFAARLVEELQLRLLPCVNSTSILTAAHARSRSSPATRAEFHLLPPALLRWPGFVLPVQHRSTVHVAVSASSSVPQLRRELAHLTLQNQRTARLQMLARQHPAVVAPPIRQQEVTIRMCILAIACACSRSFAR